jgi:recombination protein RecA
MSAALALRAQIEAALAHRIPSALTPVSRIIRPVTPTGITAIDDLLEGGLPIGAITEMVGPECSGRTALALSFVAQITNSARVCAWIDVSDTLHPESAAAAGVDLKRLLWVRCGVPATTPTKPIHTPRKDLAPPPKTELSGGRFGSHPRNEVKGLSKAVGGLLKTGFTPPRCAEPQRRTRPEQAAYEPAPPFQPKRFERSIAPGKPWSRIEQALRVTDLLLQAGGFSAIILDMGSLAPEHALRIPLATWFRYRAAAERTQASILLLTQHACAKSSAELVLSLRMGDALQQEATVFAGIEHRIEVTRQRFATPPPKVVPLRKPPRRETAATWNTQTPWAGRR